MLLSSSRKGVGTLKALNSLAFILVIVGALNWGLVGLFDLNLVTLIFGENGLHKLVYDLVGVSAVIVAYNHFKK